MADQQHATWPDLAIGLYERLTGRNAAINYQLQDFEIEVPKDTKPDSPRAKWRFNGTIRITTAEPKSGQ